MRPHRYKTWDEAVGLPESYAPLQRLPGGLAFPADFPEPICFDEQRKRLIYRGFMCSASYVFLHGLAADPPYIAAVDALFQATAYTLQRSKRRKRGRRLWLWLLALAGLAAALVAVWKWRR